MAASKRNKTSPKNTAATVEPTARHLWLASLGTLVAVRREAKAGVKRASSKVEDTIADARFALRRAKAELSSGMADVRGQVQPKMTKLSGDVEARLAPIVAKLGLDKFGMQAKAKRAPRKGSKPAAKKPTMRRTTRKPAKRAAKNVAG